MYVAGGDPLESVAGGGVGKERHLLATVEAVDRSREAGRLAGEARDHERWAAALHGVGEGRARVAGRSVPVEDHVAAMRLEALDPSGEAGARLEQRRAD